MKGCSRCGEMRELTEFSPSKQNKDGLASVCKPCRREMAKIYWSHNKVRQSLKHAQKRRVNGESVRRYFRAYQKRRREANFQWRFRVNLRSRIAKALRRNPKSARTVVLIGCSIVQLREHLERQFRHGMTWENYGPVWHVDHIRPCVSFDFSSPAQQRECFHFTNLQPLFAAENLRKAAKLGLTFS